MSKPIATLLIALFALLVLVAVAFGLSNVFKAPNPAPSRSNVLLGTANMQSSDGGGVQIQVTFAPTGGRANQLLFQVAMNTHSVELGDFDLSKLSRVTLEPGGVLSEAEWKPEGSGKGHHVTGSLSVKDPKGLIAGARKVRLELLDVAGVPVRPFEWQAAK